MPDLRDARSTVDELIAAAGRFGWDGWVLFPTRDETVCALARHRDELATRFRVPTPGWTAVRSCWDKRETYRLAEELGIAHPRTWVPRDPSDVAAIDGPGPYAVKPAIKEHFFYATGVKAWRADGPADLTDVVRRAVAVAGAGEIIVQELVPGDGEQQYSYCAFVKQGRALASMTVRRRRQHPSDFGRASTYVETVDLPELERPSLRFLAAIDFYGLVELEYKRDHRDGAFKLLDVNARTWGYHSLGMAAGVDFPYLLYADQIRRPATLRNRRPRLRACGGSGSRPICRTLSATSRPDGSACATTCAPCAVWTPKPCCRQVTRCRGSTSSRCCPTSPYEGVCDA